MTLLADDRRDSAPARPAYDAFVSYPHAADGGLAPALAKGRTRSAAPVPMREATTS